MRQWCGYQKGVMGLKRIIVILFALLGFIGLSIFQSCSSRLETKTQKSRNIDFQGTGNAEGYTGLASLPVDLHGQLRNSRITLTAPIFPKYSVEGYMTFGFLTNYCSELGVNTSMAPESEDYRPNYKAIAMCAYDEFGSKPYFTPEKVLAEDLCETQIGQDYRMLTEDDVNSIDTEFIDSLPSALTVDIDTEYFDDLYYSLLTYIKTSEGNLKVANLFPGVSQRIFDIEYQSSCRALCPHEGQWVDVGTTKVQYTLPDGRGFSTVSLRCIKKARN